MNQILRSSGEQLDISGLCATCGLGESEFTQWLNHPDTSNRLLLTRQFNRSELLRHLGQARLYWLDVERVDSVRDLDSVSRTRHQMAVILHHQFRKRVFHWCDNRRRKLDFVIQHDGSRVDVFDCIGEGDDFSPRSLEAFRRKHPRGENYLLSPAAPCPSHVRLLNMDVVTCHPAHWASGQTLQFRPQFQNFATLHD